MTTRAEQVAEQLRAAMAMYDQAGDDADAEHEAAMALRGAADDAARLVEAIRVTPRVEAGQAVWLELARDVAAVDTVGVCFVCERAWVDGNERVQVVPLLAPPTEDPQWLHAHCWNLRRTGWAAPPAAGWWQAKAESAVRATDPRAAAVTFLRWLRDGHAVVTLLDEHNSSHSVVVDGANLPTNLEGQH